MSMPVLLCMCVCASVRLSRSVYVYVCLYVCVRLCGLCPSGQPLGGEVIRADNLGDMT